MSTFNLSDREPFRGLARKGKTRMRLNTFALTLFVACCGTLTAAHADSEADVLLEKMAARTKALGSLTAQVSITITSMHNGRMQQPKHSRGVMRLQRPNLAYYSVSGGATDLTVCDGKTLATLLADATCQKMPADKNGQFLYAGTNPFVNYFFTQEPDGIGLMMGADPEPVTRCLPPQKLNGTPVQIVEVRSDTEIPHTSRLYISQDGLLRRWDIEMVIKGDKNVYEVSFLDMQANKPQKPASFAYTLPKTMKVETIENPEAAMLPTGAKAPNFTLPTLDGTPFTLADALPGHRATLICFWFSHSSVWQKEMPRLQTLYDELKAKGLNILTVNIEDSPEDIRKQMLDKHFTLPILCDKRGDTAYSLKYSALCGPNNFLLDERGNIVFRMTTFGENRIRRALREMEIQ